ncbi:MAG: ATP-dependent DNA helicase RecG [Bacteroidetes bacterium]|uniref:ATP-dependent DNA helicase RecG n=1 Tax=Candidatus Merdivivens pullicola TaxID=2840872 RepID=A0A9D9NG35_9BACT|nr:ATP-dependent DNA helicase RecG [Candidatus Merdivivens pullicola]
MDILNTEIQFLPGVGPKRAALLAKELGIITYNDMLHTFPFRYVDRTNIQNIAEIVPTMAYVQIKGTVTAKNIVGEHRKSRLVVTVRDNTGSMELVFFQAIKWMNDKIRIGDEYIIFGKPSAFNGIINMVHPELESPSGKALPYGSSLIGVYPSTEKLKKAGITNKVFTKLMASLLSIAGNRIQENIPDYLISRCGLIPRKEALKSIHFPSGQAALEKASRRLKFEELFFLQLSLLKQRYVRMHEGEGIRMPAVGADFNRCYKALPFDLTGAQKRVIREIRDDMKSGRQMNRLLQGDVGSGKTLVALMSALIAIGNGFQACIMAPTEVLAQQHFNNLKKYLAPLSPVDWTETEADGGFGIALLTGSSKAKQRRMIDRGLRDGMIKLIVGTHALIEDNVVFRSLGLAVIDEQHRFGVDQRSRLWNKTGGGTPPHILVMTATPIPRTLAMTLYGDLEVSVIDELPPGRKPVKTIHATETKRAAMYNFIREQIALGRQVFIVYPLIFESEKMDYANLEKGYEAVTEAFPFPKYRTAIVHGKQSNEEKSSNMKAFADGRADILVATSVIEVGVDVPNATVMVIESAERFGLSQLHQLRGRVGRGSQNSYCILMTDFKISRESKKRIDLMCSTEDGFILAEEDMKMRGPGDIEGTMQSGMPVDLKIASLGRDGSLLEFARKTAREVLSTDPHLEMESNSLLLRSLASYREVPTDYSKIS